MRLLQQAETSPPTSPPSSAIAIQLAAGSADTTGKDFKLVCQQARESTKKRTIPQTVLHLCEDENGTHSDNNDGGDSRSLSTAAVVGGSSIS